MTEQSKERELLNTIQIILDKANQLSDDLRADVAAGKLNGGSCERLIHRLQGVRIPAQRALGITSPITHDDTRS